MRTLAVALTDETRRFERGYPPKGAWLFLTPNIEISRLAQLAADDDILTYLDLRTAPLEFEGAPQLVLLHVDFEQEAVARDAVRELARRKLPGLCFGPQVTAWAENPPEWLPNRVIGDIAQVWPAIRSDTLAGGLRPCYRASNRPLYHPPRRPFGRWPEMNTLIQTMRFAVGCCCPAAVAPWCPDRLYYGSNRLLRRRDEIIGEILSLPGKRIRLLDEDVAAEPDYYEDIFRHAWNYRRQWTVQAGAGLFRHPRLVRLLAKSGVRVLFLNESLLEGNLERAAADPRLLRQLYRRVKTLHAARMLAGAKVVIRYDPDHPPDFDALADVLCRIDLDLVEPRFLVPDGQGGWRPKGFSYRPMLTNREPGWLGNRFYAIGAILNRLARRPRRAGFYTTARYLLPHSLAYRQNFLEGLPGT